MKFKFAIALAIMSGIVQLRTEIATAAGSTSSVRTERLKCTIEHSQTGEISDETLYLESEILYAPVFKSDFAEGTGGIRPKSSTTDSHAYTHNILGDDVIVKLEMVEASLSLKTMKYVESLKALDVLMTRSRVGYCIAQYIE